MSLYRRNTIKEPKNDTNIQLQDCISCKGKCCSYVALEIDKPNCKRDYDNIRWYLMHENIHVFIDQDGIWTLEFLTKCRNLNKKYRCSIYPERPKLCRQYPQKDLLCEYRGNDLPHVELFTCSEEFEHYLKKRNIQWQWK